LSPLPFDEEALSEVKSKETLLAETRAKTGQEPKTLGKGAYGEVFGDKGPPPKAYKYGIISKEELEIGSLASELGIGPKVYGGLSGGKNQTEAGRLEMEFLEGRDTVLGKLLNDKVMSFSYVYDDYYQPPKESSRQKLAETSAKCLQQ